MKDIIDRSQAGNPEGDMQPGVVQSEEPRSEEVLNSPARCDDGWLPSSRTVASTLLRLTSKLGVRSRHDANVRIVRVAGLTVEAVRHPDHLVVIATYRGEEVFVSAIRPCQAGWQHRVGFRQDGAWLRILRGTAIESISAKDFDIWRQAKSGRRGVIPSARSRAAGVTA